MASTFALALNLKSLTLVHSCASAMTRLQLWLPFTVKMYRNTEAGLRAPSVLCFSRQAAALRAVRATAVLHSGGAVPHQPPQAQPQQDPHAQRDFQAQHQRPHQEGGVALLSDGVGGAVGEGGVVSNS